MKQKIKISLLFLLTLVFINCSKDDQLENHTHGTHNHNDEISFKQFKNETGINKFEYYKKANISKSTDFHARTIESEFITDTTGIKKYVDPINNKTTYSFKIYPIAETLSSNEYYNLVYEKIGTEWNEIIFFNTEKTNPTDARKLESSEMVYNRVSGRDGFTEVITYSIQCNGSCSGVCDGFACPTGECIKTTITYVYTGIEDNGDGSNGNPPGSGNPPSNGGGGGEGNGIYIPNPYDGEADPNNADFMLAGQVASFTNTLPNNLQTLISNYPFIYPYLVDFCRNNGYTVNSRNTQKMTTALTNFYNFQLNTSYTNLTNVNIDRFNFWAFYTFLNNNPLDVNNTKINDIKDFVQAADHETANSIVDYLFENKEDGEAIEFINEAVDALINNGEVDFDDEIIYAINKPCQNEIIKDVMNVSSPFTNLINQTFNVNDKANVKFNNGSIPGGNAYTNPFFYGNSDNFTISIRFDDTFLESSTNLGIAAVTLHELVHAYFIKLYLKGELTATSQNYNDLLNAFIAFYDNQVQDTFDTLDNELHNAMKDFIDKMGNSLYNYAINNNIDVTPDYCINLAWGTMTGTELFENALTPQQQLTCNNIYAYEQDSLPQASGTPCN